MNGPLLRWLLDLERIPEGAERLRLAWEHAWPAWAWTLIVAGAALAAAWSYLHLTGSRGARAILAALRFALIILAVTLLASPMVELPRERVERDLALILVDRSASMTIADIETTAGRISRDEQLRRIVDENSEVWRALADEHDLRWFGFHSGAFNLAAESAPDPSESAVDDPGPALGEARGNRTDLNTALEHALQRASARPLGGIIVLSDGRTSEPPGRPVRRRLLADGIQVFTIPLGSPHPLGDVAVRRADAPRRAFAGDRIPVRVQLDRAGAAAARMTGTVRLIDELTGRVLDERQLPAGEGSTRLTLTASPVLAGETEWTVVFEPGGPDLISENNRRSVVIDLVDRPLRVLYVDGYPRWEYRYLKNLLIREESVECSIFLLSADRDFAQEGDRPITRLPRSGDELGEYDVVILGDVPASYFSPEQLEMIREHVADRGAGLLWIAGERYTPGSCAGTALTDLLPMRGSLGLAAIGRAVNMAPTELARSLGVLEIGLGEEVGWPEELTDPASGWSQLYYAQRIRPDRLKPTAEVLAQTASPVDGTFLPLVMQIRYGAGRSLYVATDEIWRWRYGRGERLPDQFWIQMIRMLGRASLATAGEGARLEVSPPRPEAQRPVRIELRLLDARLIEAAPARIAALIETANGRRVGEVDLQRPPSIENRFVGTFLPEAPGRLRVRISDPVLPGAELSMFMEVHVPEDELRRPETDHPLLARLASETGGRMLPPDQIEMLPQLLPNRAVRTIDPLRESIWDTPLAFTLVLFLLTAEWIGRRLIRLN
ncbi:MAG: hypothetical protein SYC29_15395 [Planctomycetota bacterium]|nr:hypothetical protein [Planctomycetota bacterium]